MTSNLQAQVAAVRKLPLYRWVVAGVAVVALLVGAALIKTNHKTVLPVISPIAQVQPAPKPAVAPAVQAKKQPAKPTLRKATPKKS